MKKSYDFLVTVKDGGFNFGSEFNKRRFVDWSRKNKGMRVGLTLLLPESYQQRKFFEGAICPMVAFFQEGMNHRNWQDVKECRETLKIEFNGEFTRVGGLSTKIGGSTKGELNQGFLDRVVDWLKEQYGIDRGQVLNPKDYEHWRDTVFPYGGPDTYIDYLVETGRLIIPKEKQL